MNNNLEKNVFDFFEKIKESPFGNFSMDQDKKARFESLVCTLKRTGKTDFSPAEAKKFSCDDIACNLTHLPENLSENIELGEGEKFRFLARVDTSLDGNYDIDAMAKQALSRKFLSYSIVSEKNISRYKTSHDFMLVYDVPADAIVHVFPSDADTNVLATNENEVSAQPSFWITMDELLELTDQIKMYNQVTCRTEVQGKPVLPKAILVFDKISQDAEETSKRLGLPIVVSHPQKDAICYVGDSCFVNESKECAENFNNMIAVFKRNFAKYFKTRNEKKVFDAFIESFQPDLMNLVINSTFGK